MVTMVVTTTATDNTESNDTAEEGNTNEDNNTLPRGVINVNYIVMR